MRGKACLVLDGNESGVEILELAGEEGVYLAQVVIQGGPEGHSLLHIILLGHNLTC